MAFSFSRLIISESDFSDCKKALELSNEKHLQAEQRGTASCIGGVDEYRIWLGFRKGVPAWQCSCAHTPDIKTTKPCFHAIAISLVWDRSRNVPDPSQKDIEYFTGNYES